MAFIGDSFFLYILSIFVSFTSALLCWVIFLFSVCVCMCVCVSTTIFIILTKFLMSVPRLSSTHLWDGCVKIPNYYHYLCISFYAYVSCCLKYFQTLFLVAMMLMGVYQLILLLLLPVYNIPHAIFCLVYILLATNIALFCFIYLIIL